MASLADRREFAVAAWRTWGGRGLARRGRYEAAKRSGLLRRSEARWPTTAPVDARLRPVALDPSTLGGPPVEAISLYGGLDLDGAVPPDWHRHPVSGHQFDAARHWSELSDAVPEAGDIKDLWELGRFGWLQPRLRYWAGSQDEGEAEQIWSVIEDWHRANPRYLGPHWMCGQETSLRTITIMFLAQALDESETTTDERRALVAQLVHDAVGRVRPTLGYALSQRNNHASSEAGFLWTASVLAPWLPAANELRRVSARALTEVVADQFAPDGSYAQHSPTYARVALHVLLWCLAVERSTGVAAPDGVHDALARAAEHLSLLLVPDSAGCMPNLGGNDGALVFDLSSQAIGDFRPVLGHVAAATGRPSGLPAGPWDAEAACFGLRPAHGGEQPRPVPTRSTHALSRGASHLVMRSGPLAHRPAHADQLHVDLWFGGRPVAVDPGSYRYTAPAPWGNALAGEDVHNLPRRPGAPQAERAGRFFWSRWSEARLGPRLDGAEVSALSASLELADGTTMRRVVAVSDGVAVVVDDTGGPGNEVRWNLLGVETVTVDDGGTSVVGRYRARLVHGGPTVVHEPSDDDPRSGWHAPTYAQRQPLQAVDVVTGGDGRVLSVFAADDASGQVDRLVSLLADVANDADAVAAALASAIRQQ